MTAARYGGEPLTNIPVGGAAGDVLAKVSDTDIDTGWRAPASFSWAKFLLNNNYDLEIVAGAADPSAFEVDYVADLEAAAPVEALFPLLWVTRGDTTIFTVDPYDEEALVGGQGALLINRPGLLTIRLLVQAHPSTSPAADGWLDINMSVSRSIVSGGEIPNALISQVMHQHPIAPTAMVAIAEMTTWLGPENFFSGIEDDEPFTAQPYVSFSVATNNLTVGSYTVNQMEVTMELVEFG
jgi:hypothetical protein